MRRPAPKPIKVVKPKGPPGTNYALMDRWAPVHKRTNAQKTNYPDEHACAFCGAIQYRHKRTTSTSRLFCDAVCRRLYKSWRHRPRHLSDRLLPLAKPRRAPKAVMNPLLADVMRSSMNWAPARRAH